MLKNHLCGRHALKWPKGKGLRKNYWEDWKETERYERQAHNYNIHVTGKDNKGNDMT